jgi:superfamily II helicase
MTSKKVNDKTWTLQIRNGQHNNNTSARPSSHAAHKRLLPEQVDKIQKLLQSNLKPAQILLQLQTFDNQTYASNKTIRNVLQKICHTNLDRRTEVKALLCILKETNWAYDVKVKDSSAIKNLFFAQTGSIHLAWINHHVALLLIPTSFVTHHWPGRFQPIVLDKLFIFSSQR